FSPRPGTRAAGMVDRFVPDEVVADRFERLRAVVERSALLRNQARVGRIEEVLVEGESRRDPAMLTGRTRQGKPVHFAPRARSAPAAVPAPGAFAEVLVTSAAPHHLAGRLLAVTRAPRHRTRIPVAAG
ncbi:MAG: TRAM domain-containing protein, partial [Acidimicrobiales bacterium]